jgi:rod shape-determining protein MreC
LKLRYRNKGISRVLSGGWSPGLSSLVFILLALGLFVFSAVRPDGLQGLRSRTTDLFAPVLSAINRPVQVTTDYVRAISGLAALQEENTRLLQENARLREWYQTATALKSENESLHKLLNIKLPPDQTFVTARVIGDSGNAYVRTVLVMAGQQDGVRKGQAVLAGDGVIGRVIEAGKSASRVLLMTDLNSRIPVQVEGSEDNAILGGANTDLPELVYLPAASAIKRGSRIITSGHGGLFPYGLPVGEAVKAANGRWAVRPYADSEHITFVRIVNGGGDPRLHEGGL